MPVASRSMPRTRGSDVVLLGIQARRVNLAAMPTERFRDVEGLAASLDAACRPVPRTGSVRVHGFAAASLDAASWSVRVHGVRARLV